jgi:hypothetical protein
MKAPYNLCFSEELGGTREEILELAQRRIKAAGSKQEITSAND